MTNEAKQELSEFVGETYIANKKNVEDVGKNTDEIEKEKREQIDAWVNLINKLY